MNIQCPHCQKMLTVPDEHAGKAMMCPLCRGQFTMPALPPGQSAPAAPPRGPETFTLRLPPSGAFEIPNLGAGTPPPLPAAPAGEKRPAVTEAVPAGPVGGYRHAIPLRFNPIFLRWMVPLALILVFVLSFFPWVGVFPGGKDLVSQNGWQAAFGGWSVDMTFMDLLKKNRMELLPDPEADKPEGSTWLILFIILTCFGLLFALAFVVFNLLSFASVPLIQKLRRWQGLILGGIALLAFLFLLIETFSGFSLERKAGEKVEKLLKEQKPPEEQIVEVRREVGQAMLNSRRTFYYRLVFWLVFFAFIGGIMEFWIRRRGHRLYPKIEFAW